jgi:hypothetical protein
MPSGVLNGDRAVQMNMIVMRAFAKPREILPGNRELAPRLERVEARLPRHGSVIGSRWPTKSGSPSLP